MGVGMGVVATAAKAFVFIGWFFKAAKDRGIVTKTKIKGKIEEMFSRFMKKTPFILRSGVIFLIFIIPFFFVPQTYNAFELQKVILFRITVEILFAIYVFWSISRKKPIVKWGLLEWIFLVFLGLMYLSSFFGADFSQSFLGEYYRGQGFFTLIHYFLFFLIISGSREFGLESRDLFLAVSSSAVLLASVAVIQFILYNLGFDVGLFNGRYHVVFGNPNFFGAYLGVAVSFVSDIFALALLFMGVILSGSRGALLAGLLGFGAMCYLSYLRGISKKVLAALGAVLILALGIFFYANSRVSVYENRGTIWEVGFRAFMKRPILGWGLENFEYAYNASLMQGETWLKGVRVDKAHNEILEVMVSGGVLGLLAYLSLLTVFFKEAFKILRIDKGLGVFLISGAISFFLVSLTNVLSVTSYIIFWMMMGIAGIWRASGEVQYRYGKVLAGVTIVSLLFLVVFNFRMMVADHYFFKGLSSEAAGLGGKADFEAAADMFPWERVYQLKAGQK